MMRSSPIRSAVALLFLLGSVALAETVEQKYDDGTVKVKYEVDAKGKKDGPYEEFYPNGKAKRRATYKAGVLDGKSSTFFESGRAQVTASYEKGQLTGAYTEFNEKGQIKLLANYADGKLNGKLTRYDDGKPTFTQNFEKGEPAFARNRKDIKDTIKKLAGKSAKGKDDAAQRQAAFRRLKVYRYLAGVPYEKIELDDEANRMMQASAKLCEKLKRLDHAPPNAGLPEAEYKLAKTGCGRANLGAGFTALVDAVDYFMYDSDNANLAQLGHRRWSLNPSMSKTGFGRSGNYMAMYSTDTDGEDVPDYEFISWPPPGYMPSELFSAKHAWNVSFNPKKFAAPDKTVQTRIYAADAQLNKVGEPIKLNYRNAVNQALGIPYCIMFRPEKISLANNKRYLVEITGLKTADDENPRTIMYPVVFMTLK